jgi:hypothetical protein
LKVSEGTRTPDRLDHNQELYQLSYAHRVRLNLPSIALATGGSSGTGEYYARRLPELERHVARGAADEKRI